MKTLTAMVVLIGVCFLAQPAYAQGASFCEQFVVTGSSTLLKACIRELDRQAEIADNERGNELAGIAMSNVDLTKSVKDLQNSVRDIEQKTGRMKPYEVSDNKLLTDDLRDRVKELEAIVESQAELLAEQQLSQKDLQKQIDTMRAELAKKPRPVKKPQEGKTP